MNEDAISTVLLDPEAEIIEFRPEEEDDRSIFSVQEHITSAFEFAEREFSPMVADVSPTTLGLVALLKIDREAERAPEDETDRLNQINLKIARQRLFDAILAGDGMVAEVANYHL